MSLKAELEAVTRERDALKQALEEVRDTRANNPFRLGAHIGIQNFVGVVLSCHDDRIDWRWARAHPTENPKRNPEAYYLRHDV